MVDKTIQRILERARNAYGGDTKPVLHPYTSPLVLEMAESLRALALEELSRKVVECDSSFHKTDDGTTTGPSKRGDADLEQQ